MYYIGIDGGGTKSKGVLCDQDKNVIASSSAGATNCLTVGFHKAAENILTVIIKLKTEAGITPDELNGICIGSAGAGSSKNAEKLRNLVVAQLHLRRHRKTRVKLTTDSIIALEGALDGHPGVVLIAGTGSIINILDEAGNYHRIGGFGRIFGDEGSGYSIGRKALNFFSEYLDGRRRRSHFDDGLIEALGISERQQLISAVYRDGLDIAAIARNVIEMAERGNLKARELLTSEAEKLVGMLSSANQFFRGDNIPLVFSGSLLSGDNYYLRTMKSLISRRHVHFVFTTPIHPPEIGAVNIATKLK